MTGKVRSLAGLTILLFATELVALPCGAACHQTQTERADAQAAGASAEHSCHEAPVTEDLQQVAAIPGVCSHQHDVPDSPRTSASGDRDRQIASIPVIVRLPVYADLVCFDVSLSPPRHSISMAGGLSPSLRI